MRNNNLKPPYVTFEYPDRWWSTQTATQSDVDRASRLGRQVPREERPTVEIPAESLAQIRASVAQTATSLELSAPEPTEFSDEPTRQIPEEQLAIVRRLSR